MSEHSVGTDLLLVADGDSWLTWCPAIDTCTVGDNPEHAVGMAIDAIRLVFEDDLTSFRWTIDFEGDPLRQEMVRISKRVSHPLRRGREDHVRTDGHWSIYEDFRQHRGRWRRQTAIEIRELIPAMDACVVIGNVTVQARGGIVHALPAFSNYCIVPARNFDYRIQRVREDALVASVPAALLEPDSPLRRSGMSVEAVVLSYIEPDPGVNILDWSIKERPLRDPQS